jgi:hypothetical protein
VFPEQFPARRGAGIEQRRCRAQRACLGALLGLLLACFVASDASAEGEDDDVSRISEPCELAPGTVARVVTELHRQSCGNESCSQQKTIVISLDETPLVSVAVFLGGAVPGTDVNVECERHVVRLSALDVPESPRLEFGYDPGRGGLVLLSGARDLVERAWQRPASSDPEGSPFSGALRGLLETVSAPDNVAIEGMADLSAALELLAARDALAAGFLERAEHGVLRVQASLSPVLETRRRRLAREIQAVRQRTLPLRLVERRSIGTALAVQKLPLDVGELATLFWRNDELCVVAEETPAAAMRCYAAARGRWGPPVPVARPTSSGHELTSIELPHVLRCSGGYVTQRTTPPGPTPCNGGPGESSSELVGIVDRDAMLLERGRAFVLNRAPARDEARSVRAGNELLRRSAGSFVVGDGCCRFLQSGALRRLGDDDERVFDVLGPPPAGESWLGPPLASPDQRWVVAQSGFRPGPRSITLFLFRVERLR